MVQRMKEQMSRRLVLLATGAGLAALACGEDADEASSSGEATTTSNTTTGTNGSGSGSSGSSSSAGGSSASGNPSGGSSAGGADGSGGGSTGSSMGNNACMGILVVKGSNYAKDPHDLMIPLADLVAGQTKSYTSTGNNHTHNVTLTADDFLALSKGLTVKKYTCLDNPKYTDHEWVFSCADPNIMPTFEGEIGTKANCPGDQA